MRPELQGVCIRIANTFHSIPSRRSYRTVTHRRIFSAFFQRLGLVWPGIPVSYILDGSRHKALCRQAVLSHDCKVIGTTKNDFEQGTEPPGACVHDKTFSIGSPGEPIEYTDLLQQDLGTDVIMLQKCVIIGLALLLIGGLATAWVHKQTQAERAKASADGTNYSLGPEEYLDKYGRWYQLSPEQQNQLVLELDRDRQNKTSEQLALEQKARLRADLDKLAAGQMEPGDIADILYGVGWQDEVERSKKLKEKMEIAQIISIVCLSIGSVLFAVCILVWVLRSFVRFLRTATVFPGRR